jgi:hypothetical protein
MVTIPLTNNTDCISEYQTTGNVAYNINPEYQICLKNRVFIVPGSCDVSRGGGVYQKLNFYYQQVSYVYAINSFGDNCGFGTPIVATKIQPHLAWINSVVFGNAPSKLAFSSYVDWVKELPQSVVVAPQKATTPNDGIVFSVDKEAGDLCHHGQAQLQGKCMEASKCNGGHTGSAQNVHREICAVSPKVLICCIDMGSIRGCAYKNVNLRLKNTLKSTLEIEQRPSKDNELVHIGELYVVQNPSDNCHTTLISDQHAVTSAKCAAK